MTPNLLPADAPEPPPLSIVAIRTGVAAQRVRDVWYVVGSSVPTTWVGLQIDAPLTLIHAPTRATETP